MAVPRLAQYTVRKMQALVLAFFFLSGVAGLLYEVVWIRVAGTVIGNTTYAVGTVVGVYMGGLALGAWLGGRAADRRGGARLLRLYGLLEAGVAVSALAVPFLFHASEPLFRLLWNSVGEIAPLYAACRIGLVALALAVPTTLMGATLPVLARFLSGSAEDAPRRAGTAYAINTLGGVAGTLAAGFWLIPAFGLQTTTLAAAAMNAAIGAGSLLLARGREGTIQPAPPPEPPPRRLALAVAALSGFAALVYEIAWTRAIVLALGSTVYAFTLILAAFILGLAAGSAAASRLRPRDPIAALGWIQAAAGVAALALLPFLGNLPLFFTPFVESAKEDYSQLLRVQFLLIFAFVFVPTFILGAVFPFTCRLAGGSDHAVGRSVAAVYSWNTVGSIAGSWAGSFLLLPALGPAATVRLAAVVNLGLAAYLAWRERPALRLAPAAPVAVAAAAWLLPGWDLQVLASGPYIYGDEYVSSSRARRLDLRRTIEAESTLLASYWDAYGLVTVHQHPKGMRSLRINGKTDASTGPADMMTQLLIGHLPLLHHPEARRALVIGLGAGVTVEAMARYPLERIECVEISSAVARAAEHFQEVNRDVLRDPRVRLIEGDGRNALAFGRETYDVIVSEPSNLWLSGMANLFTRDFFEDASRRLAPGGLFCQWVHAYRLPLPDFRSVLRTFYAAFPHGSVWEVFPGQDYVLIGAREPLRPSFARLEGRFAIPAVRAQLEDPAAPGPEGFLGYLVTDADGARRLAGPGAVLTDDHCPIEYTAPRAIYRNVPSETIRHLDPARGEPVERSLYEGLPAAAAEAIARRRRGRREFAELTVSLPHGTPREALEALNAHVARYGSDRLVRTYMNRVARRARVNARVAQEAGDFDLAIRILRTIPPECEGYAEAQLQLVALYLAANRASEAEAALRQAASEPQSFTGTIVRAFVTEKEGRLAQAIELWREALRLDPASSMARLYLAKALHRAGKPEEAREEARRAAELDPGNTEAHRFLETLLKR